MRLPPPSRRYSAISVIVLTLEAASRASSCSMPTRSSRSSSKTSLAVAMVSVLNSLRFSLRAPSFPFFSAERVGTFFTGCPPGLPLGTASLFLPLGWVQARVGSSIRPVIRKRQLHAQVLAAQQSNNRLQLVAIFARNPHR